MVLVDAIHIGQEGFADAPEAAAEDQYA